MTQCILGILKSGIILKFEWGEVGILARIQAEKKQIGKKPCIGLGNSESHNLVEVLVRVWKWEDTKLHGCLGH